MRTLAAAGFAAGVAAGFVLPSFFASFTGPDAPIVEISQRDLIKFRHTLAEQRHFIHKTCQGPQASDLKQHSRDLANEKRSAEGNFIEQSVPFGCVKSPFSAPVWIARLNWVLKIAGVAAAVLLLARMYFLIA